MREVHNEHIGEANMNDLRELARKVRELAIEAIYCARSGHPGGSLSAADILSVLYFEELRVDPTQPLWIDRDRFILSKGHACPAQYAVLALKGFFPAEDVRGLRKIDHYLEGHPDVKIPGVDAPSGSLGMGLSQGLGMALGAHYRKKSFRTYVLLGDGDMQEGNTWEAFMAAGHHKVASLTAILDYNGLQGEDLVTKQMDYTPIAEKLTAFGWHVQDVDGHNIDKLRTALAAAQSECDRPSFILARTIKGKGVEFMENQQVWHGSSTLTDEQYHQSLKYLEA
jgi:transketolase